MMMDFLKEVGTTEVARDSFDHYLGMFQPKTCRADLVCVFA